MERDNVAMKRGGQPQLGISEFQNTVADYIIGRLATVANAGSPSTALGRIMPQPETDWKPQMPNSDDLKSSGLKATAPRLKILELFHKTQQNQGNRHMTAEDVYRLLLAENLDVGLATVYRVLTQFEQAGLLQRHHFESGKAVFELNEGSHHDHLVCLQCGRVEEFYDAQIEQRQIHVARERGFAVNDHALYLYADCIKKDCEHAKGSR
jgi:Fur family transcriptional regulator, ferric uptake regulator